MSAPPSLSVILPAYNPDLPKLRRTLAALKAQSLPAQRWETIFVNNASTRFPAPEEYRDASPGNLRLVEEPRLGLTYARIRGFSEARADVAVLVDDDNVLEPNYLGEVLALFERNPTVGALGGRSLPEFAVEPAPWVREFHSLLAVRDLGDAPIVSRGLRPGSAARNEYPGCAPIGAGMAIRRGAWEAWMGAHASSPSRISDRRGTELTSGGDNDIVLWAMRAGWEVGYFPSLSLKHLIAEGRLDAAYLARLNRGIQRSWMQVLYAHDANPWPPISRPGSWLRKVRAWFKYRSWSSPSANIRWQGSCGHFDGRVAGDSAP